MSMSDTPMSDLRIDSEMRRPARMNGLLPRAETPIVPKNSIAGRALVAVVAIMTFLSSLTVGAVMLVRVFAGKELPKGYTFDQVLEWMIPAFQECAEYGKKMGSQVMIVSKGGTNSLHGSLFEYFRNSVLDARNFFDYKSAASQRRSPPWRPARQRRSSRAVSRAASRLASSYRARPSASSVAS